MKKLLKGALSGVVLSSMLLGGVVSANADSVEGDKIVKTSVFALSSTSEVASLADATSKDIKKTDIDWTAKDLSSNDDTKRREELSKQLGIKITEKHAWADKKGEKTVGSDGRVVEYTSHDDMKKAGYYAVNANRQELIQYGIQEDDWQPYRAFEAKDAPLYFEIVDGKYEYSKIFYANQIQTTILSYGYQIYDANILRDDNKVKELTAARDKAVKEYYADLLKAPGEMIPYIAQFNSSPAWANYWGVEEAPKAYFDSKYNDPSVLPYGKFTEKK